jgi:hypothetical protein
LSSITDVCRGKTAKFLSAQRRKSLYFYLLKTHSEADVMDPQLRTTDLAVLVLYLGAVFGLGCWFARKSGTTQEFMAAGGSIPGWAVGLSILGTYVSSIGFLGSTGKQLELVGVWTHFAGRCLVCRKVFRSVVS